MRVRWTIFLAVLGLGSASGLRAGMSLRVPESSMIGGLIIGATSRSFEPMSLVETMDRARQSGAMVLEIQAGQSLSAQATNTTIGEGMAEEEIALVRRKVVSSGVRLVAARVRFSANASANTRLFEWADALDIQVLVGEPPVDQFDHLERLIRRFNIGVGLWTAPRIAGAARGGWTDPKAVMTALRGRDPRFGVVLNLLNVVRAGVDPFQALSEVRTRVVGIQIADLSDLTPQARPVPFGTGTFDFHRLLTQLDTQRFDGYLAFDRSGESEAFFEDLNRGLDYFRRETAIIRRENLLRLASRGVTVAPGLRYEVLTQGEIPEPTLVAAGPDGGMWFGSRRGYLWAWSEADRTNHLITRFSVSNTGQRGLYSLAFDPGFATNGYLYVYRAPILAVGNSNRVSRFTATSAGGRWAIEPSSEQVLLEIPGAAHGLGQGGGLLLQPRDGYLYVGVGDNNLPNETPRFFDDPRNAPQDLGSLQGKILRIRTDGIVPGDNPLQGHPGARPEIFAFGLRNPFSLSWDAETDRVFVGDVGYDRREDFEEINVLVPGGNYGWPRCDGRGLDTLAGTPCPLPDTIPPWFGYRHESSAAVVLGPYLPGRPPAGWPERHQRGLIYGDYSRRLIRLAQVGGPGGTVTNTVTLATGLAGGPASFSLGPRGELFFVEYAGRLAGSPMDRLSRLVPEGLPPLRPDPPRLTDLTPGR